MWQLSSGVLLGWSLGANDASNVFGTAVASRMVRFTTAAVLCAAFVLLGAMLEGRAGMATYQAMSPVRDLGTAFVVALGAAVTVALMTWRKLPVSTSQAVVGSLVAVGLWQGKLQLAPLAKVIICWVATPLGALVAAAVLYLVLGLAMDRLDLNLFAYDRNLRIGLVLAGSYGAYALGANNVANVTGMFAGSGMLSPGLACLVGGVSIGLGVLTYSRRVMMTVGRGLVRLDAYTAFVVVLSMAVTVHVFAWVGVPVSTSQAVVGAVLGIGLMRGARTVNRRTLWHILLAWLGTPAASFVLTLAAMKVTYGGGGNL